MSAISRVAKTAGKYASRSWQQLAKAETQGTSVAVQQFVKQSRSYASGGGHHDSVTHAGVTIHKAAKWHVYTGEAMAGLMWFWIFYRFYNDYDTFLFGHAQHHELEIYRQKNKKKDDHHH
ncbi:hypothetical protein Ndes2526B_g01078 [Nannochloris sp. 'desiccata']|nr:hypothetical protein NADE_008647 [Chlorella desiccata (nom. nud.)]